MVAAFTIEEIDRWLGDGPEKVGAKIRAKALLAERQAVAAWDELDERVGYSRVKHAEEEAFAIQDERITAIFAQSAHSVAGATAKLHAVVAMGEEDGAGDRFPWPQIRAVMAVKRHRNMTSFRIGLPI